MNLTHSLINLCCFVLKQTWRLYRTRSISKISMKFVHKKDKRQNGDSSWLLMWAFLPLYSKTYPWGVQIQWFPNHFWGITNLIIWLRIKTQKTIQWQFVFVSSSCSTTSLQKSITKNFNFFLEKSGCDPKQFRGVSMDNLPIAEDVQEKNIFIYDIDIEDGD